MTLFYEKLSQALWECQEFTGPQATFWSRFAHALVEHTSADKSCVLRRSREGDGEVQIIAFAPHSEKPSLPVAMRGEAFDEWLAECEEQGYATRKEEPVRSGSAMLLKLEVAEGERCSALLYFEKDLPLDEDLGGILRLIANTPALYIRNQQLQLSQADVRNCVQTLDILSLLNEQKEYKAMVMALCNEAKRRYNCERVSLGYHEEPYVRLQAISNLDRFGKKMDIVGLLESVMEECVDQDEDLLYPAPKGSGFILRDHETYAKAEGVEHLLSVPLRHGEKTVGALTFERATEPFLETDVKAARVLADQVERRVVDMKKQTRWFGARMLDAVRDSLGGLLGYRHTWRKLFAIVGTAVLLTLIFVRVEYRVEAPFILQSSEITHVPAPFKGFLSEVMVKVGDLVNEREPLLRLDTSELLLERANTLAEIQRFASEAEKAEAERRISDMLIAQAQKKQSQANLELLDYRIRRANVEAPYEAIIVEGDLTDRIGAPVEKGDLLMRMTRMDNLYVEMKADERDIHDITDSVNGEFAFNSKPDSHFPFDVIRIEPVAMPDSAGNVFYVNGDIQGAVEDWWRPGMSGIAKINAGERSLMWICTHRLVDFLRLKLWW